MAQPAEPTEWLLSRQKLIKPNKNKTHTHTVLQYHNYCFL